MSPDPSNPLINLGDLTKPASKLVKKISNAAGILYKPLQIRKVAKAKADAALIEAQSDIEITDLHRRAAHRWIEEEAQQQKIMEDITAKALPQLNESAKPDSMDNDWIVNFFDKCRIVSDNEMQELWSRILAGEANAPGTYSKRTVNFLSDLEKGEADLFTRLCGFGWVIGNFFPLVFDEKANIYNKDGINFNTLNHLDSIDLIRFDGIGSFYKENLPKRFSVTYFGKLLTVEMPHDAVNKLDFGKVMLTRIGDELVPICGSKPVDGFWEYVKEKWKQYLPKSEVE